jgi:alkanesulfonate monooxygenase SsuD/methylene tetrahydromethanopterin reductase-like flavin-dependent oxidoreductase (luciferase family)
VRYGFYLPTRGLTATPEALEALVLRGDALGFHSVMIADHIVFPVTIDRMERFGAEIMARSSASR